MNNKDKRNKQNLDVGKPGIEGEGNYTPPENTKPQDDEITDTIGTTNEQPGLDEMLPPLKAGAQYAEEASKKGVDGDAPYNDELSESVPDDDPVEYDAGADSTPMEDIAAEDNGTAKVAEAGVDHGFLAENETERFTVEPLPETKIVTNINQSEHTGAKLPAGDSCDADKQPKNDFNPETQGKITEVKPSDLSSTEENVPDKPVFIEQTELKNSEKTGFNPNSKQDARYDTSQEGGVARPQTTGPQKTDGDASKEGHMIKPSPPPKNIDGKYEVSGFNVSYEEKAGQGLISHAIMDYFDNMETAQASVNGSKYLMSLADGGFKVVSISSGAPKISFDEREIYCYTNDKNVWSRI